MIRHGAMLRLAKESCDPKLLYSFFKAMEQSAPDDQAGAVLHVNMVRNMCLPDVVCEKLRILSDPKEGLCHEHERGIARWDPKVREAEAWKPVR
jgi:hypothetical protein